MPTETEWKQKRELFFRYCSTTYLLSLILILFLILGAYCMFIHNVCFT